MLKKCEACGRFERVCECLGPQGRSACDVCGMDIRSGDPVVVDETDSLTVRAHRGCVRKQFVRENLPAKKTGGNKNGTWNEQHDVRR